MDEVKVKDIEVKVKDIEEVSDKILTVPNIISFCRLLLVPVFFALLAFDQRIAALIVFAVAACSDFIDGQVARRTHQVSKLGKLLDPAVDTVLMFSGVLATVIIGECPLWIAVFIIARELFLLIGGAILLATRNIHIAVIYPGKFATTFLFFGFAGLLLGIPTLNGLGICDFSWLSGFNSDVYCFWIWFVYIGLALQIGVTVYYCVKAYEQLYSSKEKQ